MKRFWYPLLVCVVAGVIYYMTRPRPVPPTETIPATVPIPQKPNAPKVDSEPATATIAPAPPQKGPRPFYGELPPGVKSVKQLTMINSPSSEWPEKLRARLLQAGGEQLKDLKIEPQESYIIMDGPEARNVERVVITVHAKDGRMNRFFAEVDSESGHVTKTWGNTIHEGREHQD